MSETPALIIVATVISIIVCLMRAPQKRGVVVWFTGIPASGKSTIAVEVERRLCGDYPVNNLDSDDVRQNLTPDLGYSPEDRDENTRRLAWMAKTLARCGAIALVTCVSPKQYMRERAGRMAEEAGCEFIEVFVDCPVEICQERDPKGLYARAARGEVNDIAGMHMPYEAPNAPEVHCLTHLQSVQDCTQAVIAKLKELGYLALIPSPPLVP